ncbi:Mitochondrial distribution and morphology protein 10 [Cyphellophora attinorum]|uniref:Mitochondrial distribution and morphology protein 10 n=1 Tax=Cyphellophora attinorum TaxID=1664694 RepID=A0A0N1GXL7_9EURO|nr:Mitochondrial distribution and morphology protein 10 [Phialophora attinorum]KPI35135.1 Mitochondrial distribution and morphology protein 10 [Phialophora attinorum]
MISFMDYMVLAFGTATDWNPDNSYSFLTATSDALLSFDTPRTLSLHVSSLSSNNFASSYTLSTLGQIDGSISYLYSSHPLGYIPAQSTSIPLRNLVRGYRDLRVPKLPDTSWWNVPNGRKPTLLYARLALPPPTVLTAVYARRISPETLLSLSLYSKSTASSNSSAQLNNGNGTPPASVLTHLQHDTGRYSIEGLLSTDSALLGCRGLYNFGLDPPEDLVAKDRLQAYRNRLSSKPSLLSAGAEFYYSPFSHVIGMSTGLRFTTLAPHITPGPSQSLTKGKPLAGTAASLLSPANLSHSSFPYTMTLTLNPLVGGIASTYSVRPTPNLALSSRFDFNFYSWESRYVFGAEVWRGSTRSSSSPDDPVHWARKRAQGWFSPEEQALKDERFERENENVVKLRVDDGWNVKALWTGRVKALLVSCGVTVSPSGVVRKGDQDGVGRPWSGKVGVSLAYST